MVAPAHTPYHSRLAPTPSGYLHAGNGLNFLLTSHLVRQRGGTLRLRIDDLDAPRVQPEYIQDVFDTLDWLGIAWEHGPRDAADHAAHYSQSLRIPQYNALLNDLSAAGAVFACTCSRKQLAGLEAYPGTCRHKGLPLDHPDAAWRLITPEGPMTLRDLGSAGGVRTIDLAQVLPYPVVRRRDGLPAYHIATVWDEVLYGINLVVRGEDLLPSTAVHAYLGQLLDMPTIREMQWYHHPLITDATGAKLSKSAGASSLRAVREAGLSAEGLWERMQSILQAFY